MRRTIRLCAVGALAASVVVALPASASDHLETVLTGVDNGRGLTFDADGNLWVASSGVGGTGPCVVGPEGGDACYGETGAILMLGADAIGGDPEAAGDHVFLGDLPSHAGEGGAEGIGPADVSLGSDGWLYYTMGLGADPAVRTDGLAEGARADQFATLRRVDPTDATTDEEVADLGAFEAANDPDGQAPDSNPFGLVADTDTVTVLDSGANAVLEVALPGGGITLGATLPPTFVPAPAFLGAPNGTNIPSQAVPTGLAELGDGTFAVGQLTGFPFAPGAAGVWTYDEGAITPRHVGFTNVMDVAQGPDGALYVLEIAHEGLLNAEGLPMGALLRVTTDGDEVTRELLVDDLPMPGGMAIGPDGHVYVTTMSAGPDGTVVRFDPTGDPLLSVTDDSATTTEDHRLVAGDADGDAFTTVVADVAANDDPAVVDVRALDVARGAVSDGSIAYQPPAHFRGTDAVPYEACNGAGNCVNGVLTVTVAETPTDRIAGENRALTAVEASQGRYPDGAPAVLVARADLYPDALAGGPLAATVGGPILLTAGDSLDAATAGEIARLGAATAYVLGGEAAISGDVEDAVGDLVADVQRIHGENRFATAVAIKDALETMAGTPHTQAYVVEGYDADPNRGWPDAVAVSALASYLGQPILLAETDRLPDETAAALAGLDATVIGGPVAISDATQAAIDDAAEDVSEIAGTTRYHTSQLVAEAALDQGMTAAVVSLVSGGNWPDALVAGPLVAASSGSFLLVHPTDLAASPETVAFLQDHGPFDDVDLFGGRVAISTAVEAGIAAANAG